MKHAIAAVFLAGTSIVAMGQSVDQAAIGQQQRQLANAGAEEGKKAYNSSGIYGVAKAVSDCLERVRAGKTSAHKCMGMEVVGLVMKDKTPVNANTETGMDWFASKNITNRVYAYCFMFLGIKSDMACGLAFASAKMASDDVVVSIKTTYKGDLTGEPEAKTTQDNQTVTVTEGEKMPDDNKPELGEGPAYKCSKASKRVEFMICEDKELSRLDLWLYKVYTRARMEHPRSHDGDTGKSSFPLGDDQTKWRLKVRDACKDVACVKTAYERRVVELKTKFPY